MKSKALPSRIDVTNAVKSAMYSSDPIKRAEAAARLVLWGYPSSPIAIVMAAERDAALASA